MREALSAVRQGYDYADVEQFDDDQRERASQLVQDLMDEVEAALEAYNASDFADTRAEIEADALIELIKYCRDYVEEHPDITTVYEGEAEGSPIPCEHGQVAEVGPEQTEDKGEEGAAGLNATLRNGMEDQSQYDEFDGTMPSYDPPWTFHGEKSLPLPPTRPPRSRDSSRLDSSEKVAAAVGGPSLADIMAHSPPPLSLDPLITLPSTNPGAKPPPPSPQQYTRAFGSTTEEESGNRVVLPVPIPVVGKDATEAPVLDTDFDRASSVPSLTGTQSNRSSAFSQRSVQLQRHAAEDIAKEDARLEENRQYLLAQKADLLRQLEECDGQWKMDEELARQKKLAISENLRKGMEYIAEQEVLVDPSGTVGMEITSTGLGLGGEPPNLSTEKWVKEIGKKSEAKVTPSGSFSVPPEAASTARKPARVVNFRSDDSVKQRTPSASSLHRVKVGRKIWGVEEAKLKKEADKKEKVLLDTVEEKQKEINQLEELYKRQLEELRVDMEKQRDAAQSDAASLRIANEMQKFELRQHEERAASAERKAPALSSLNPVAPSYVPCSSVSPSGHSPSLPLPPPHSVPVATAKGVDDLTRVQVQILAMGQLKEARPKVKFSGGRRLDFEKQMRLFAAAMRSPGVSYLQRLQELQHYFEGPALQLIECFLLREDAEAAFKEALDCLRDKFGTRQESAMEMLEVALAGKLIAKQNHAGLLQLYASLNSVISIARVTGRAADFELQSVVDAILRKKASSLAG